MFRIEKTQRIILTADNEKKFTHNQGLCLNFSIGTNCRYFLGKQRFNMN